MMTNNRFSKKELQMIVDLTCNFVTLLPNEQSSERKEVLDSIKEKAYAQLKTIPTPVDLTPPNPYPYEK